MRRMLIFSMLVISFIAYNHAQAQFENPRMALGLNLGGAQGSNASGDSWVMKYGGFFHYEFVPALLGQVHVNYTNLSAPNVYSAQIIIADFRLLVVPFSLPNLNPFLYGGIGLSKTTNIDNSDFLPIIPFGIGVQSNLTKGVLLQVSGGYNLSTSDKMDGRARLSNDLNPLTNQKQDGFYDFTIGLAFSIGGDNGAAEKEAARLKAEQAELRARELAIAEARRVQDSAKAATEARHVQEANAAEARRVREANNAAAEAARLKGSNIAEAQRIKDSTNAAMAVKDAANAAAMRAKDSINAAALKLAEQKSRDTIIVLTKGKTVILKGVNFEFNKATLTKYSEKILWKAYNAMVANPDVRVVITGHTDNVGDEKSNQALSLRRAQAVKNWLVDKGIASNRMRTVGRGKLEPIADNNTEQGRLENRRIEFYVEQ